MENKEKEKKTYTKSEWTRRVKDLSTSDEDFKRLKDALLDGRVEDLT